MPVEICHSIVVRSLLQQVYFGYLT